MARASKYMLIFNDEEKTELEYLLAEAINDHPDLVKELTNDDSTKAEEFRLAVADEFHRQAVRIRLQAMLRGGE